MTPRQPFTDDELAAAARAAVQALPDAPDAWLQRAYALVPEGPSPLVAAVAAAGRLLQAVLAFDSWAQPALAAGMRSASTETRHLLYSVEGRDIDLRIAPAGGAFTLAGQVLGPDEAGRVALASTDGGATREAELDDLGEFRLEGLPRGRYALTLRVAGDEIRVAPLEIGD